MLSMLKNPAPRRSTTEAGSSPGARRRRRGRFAALLATLATAITSLTLIGATPASAAGNVYEIQSGNAYGNGLRVDVMWASTNAYQGAFLWSDNASLSQEFALLDSGGGYYRIQARHSGQCLMLDWRAGTYSNGTKVIQYPYCNAGYAGGEWYTQWIYRKETCGTSPCFDTSSWYALIRNRATGKCLDASNGAGGLPGQQAVLQQWDCITSPYQWNAWNQMWSFKSPTSAGGPVVK
jgi:hypothetical protein